MLIFSLEKLNCGFFTHFTREKTPQNNFSSQNFSVENNYLCWTTKKYPVKNKAIRPDFFTDFVDP